MRFLPIVLDLAAGTVALIGSGAPALNKLRLLRAAQANVRWYTGGADVAEEIVQMTHGAGRLEVCVQDPLTADLSGVLAVVSAIGSPLDRQVAARALAAGIPVNVLDRPELSSFIVPAIVDRGEVVVAIGTGGASPYFRRASASWRRCR
jgi:uroporphyrin-III C-methyltransferase/precorrin-2 dehydrogenase/sirohydrochlorin ferrochelatase